MKKFIFMLVMILLCMAFAIALADNTPPAIHSPIKGEIQAEKPSSQTFNLPASLQVIEEEAFEGTAVTNVNLPETVTTIEDRAFAETTSLRFIYIPKGTTFIGKDVFAGTSMLTITSTPTSYARAWARENRIPFTARMSLTAQNTATQPGSLFLNKKAPEKLSSTETIDEHDDPQPQARSDGEVKTMMFEECIEHNSQGHSPPMAG